MRSGCLAMYWRWKCHGGWNRSRSNWNSFNDGDPYGAIGPNFNSYTCTVDKDYIIDLNGNTMSEDYVFTFSE